MHNTVEQTLLEISSLTFAPPTVMKDNIDTAVNE